MVQVVSKLQSCCMLAYYVGRQYVCMCCHAETQQMNAYNCAALSVKYMQQAKALTTLTATLNGKMLKHKRQLEQQ